MKCKVFVCSLKTENSFCTFTAHQRQDLLDSLLSYDFEPTLKFVFFLKLISYFFFVNCTWVCTYFCNVFVFKLLILHFAIVFSYILLKLGNKNNTVKLFLYPLIYNVGSQTTLKVYQNK